EAARRDQALGTVAVAHPRMDDAARGDVETGDVAAEREVDSLAAPEIVTVQAGEIHRRRIAERDVAQRVTERDVGRELRQLEDAHGWREPGLEIPATDRPGAVEPADLVLEVDRLQRPAPAAPVVRRAAELPQPADRQRQQGRTAVEIAFVDGLRGFVPGLLAGLEQQYGQPGFAEGARDRSPRGSGANDADVGPPAARVERAEGIGQHQRSLWASSQPSRCSSNPPGSGLAALPGPGGPGVVAAEAAPATTPGALATTIAPSTRRRPASIALEAVSFFFIALWWRREGSNVRPNRPPARDRSGSVVPDRRDRRRTCARTIGRSRATTEDPSG